MSGAAKHVTSARVRWVAAAWAAALVALLLWPMLSRGGHFLARDLVFLPRHSVTWAALGLTDGAPRAVPLDAVVSGITQVVDGGVLARVIVPGFIILAATGVVRLLPGVGVIGALVAAGVAVWNPFVSERLALGQWALMSSYAALPWLVASLSRHRDAPAPRSLAPIIGWTLLASLTPTGGVVAFGVIGAHWWVARGSLVPLILGALAQAPWVVAGVTATAAATSDRAGVTVFAPDTESRWGTTVALLGLSGIWDADSEPRSRTTLLGLITALVVVLVLVAAARRLRGSRPQWTLLLAGLVGLAWALLETTPWGQSLAQLLVAQVPGGGLLRDGQKFLLPLALATAVAGGLVADRAARWARDREAGFEIALSGAMVAVLAPLVLLPDGAAKVWATVTPVTVPDSFEMVNGLTSDSQGYLVTVPWRSYRRFAWGNGTTSSDPASRALSAPVITSDDLQVGSTLVEGEGVVTGAVGDYLEQAEELTGLGGLGVQWVLVYPDDPEVDEVSTLGLRLAYDDANVRLYEVEPVAPVAAPGVAVRVSLALAYGVVLGLALAGAAMWWRSRRSSILSESSGVPS